MKNFYLAFLVFISFFANSQKVDYDHSSKWFLGVNVGGTWQSTDVKNQTSAGWGLILGKSFNYDYGKILSFDLRGRYLRGYWYGQDNDTTSLSNYTSGALTPYKNQYGFTVNNFQADVQRLAIELAIHLNAITEKTRLDPYVFGGVGLTWKTTFGDLLLNDTSSLYNYTSLLSNGTINSNQLDATLDKIYDTPLDGSKKSYSAYFMPSLGFGLGYQIGRRATLGIEHKTTFTLRDDFDGYVSSTPRAKNDLYHYTSVYLKFRFRVRNNETSDTKNENTVTNSSSNISNFTTNCPTPVITISNQNNITVNNAVLKIEAKVTEITAANSISLLDNNNQPITFTFNQNSKVIEANVNLNPGVNTFTIKAENNCGKDAKTLIVNYVTCDLPYGNFTNPNNNQITVQNQNFVLSALLNGIQNPRNISLFQNGILINNPSYNINSGLLQSNVILQPGNNIFKIEYSNNCGNGSISTSINYNNCIAPTIQFTSPTVAGTTINSEIFKVTARISNYNNGKLTVIVNGINQTNYTNNNGILEIPLRLNVGNNTISISITNDCGTDTETTSILYQSCDAPIVTISSPLSNSIVTNPIVALTGKLENVTGKQFIKVLLNNINVTNFNYNTSTKFVESNLTLVPGNNTITISSTNNCGTDIETINIQYEVCKTPIVSFSNTNSTVTNSAYIINALIQNMSSSQGLTLTQNGLPINYTFLNGVLSSSTALNPGVNTFILTASRICGSSTKTLIVKYDNCIPPLINLINPAASGITVNNSSYSFKALVSNVSINEGITLKFNGVSFPFTFTNGIVEANVTLTNGNNNFIINAANSCGNDNETSIVNLVNCTPPQISLINPNGNITVTNSGFNYQANISGISNSSGITLKQNGQLKAFTFVNGQLNASLNLLPGSNNITLSITNNCGNDVVSSNITYDNCIPPVISILKPTQLTLTTTNNQFFVQAQISNSTSDGITLTQNGTNINYTYNNGILNANITLLPGNNTIAISTLNGCGNDVEFINVSYNNCIAPVVNLISPANSGTTVNTSSYNFTASVQNMTSLQGIVLTMNGNVIQGATLNNGVISANVNLSPGLNSFSISATNSCGNDLKNCTINFNNCTAPILNIVTPSISGLTVVNSAFNLLASVQNISSLQGITITMNGIAINNANFSNGQISANVTLTPGVNNFFLSATNSCGNDTKSFTVVYDDCKTPSIQMNSTSSNNQTVISSNYTFNAIVQNLTSNQGIVLTINGNAISDYTFINGHISANVILTPGLNTFSLSATNACGTDNGNSSVTYNNCIAPIVNFTTIPVSGSTITTSTLSITAEIINYNSSTVITVKANGNIVNSYNNNNGIISKTVNLPIGTNTFEITAVNECGSDTKSYTIKYDNCKAPVVQINSQSVNNQTVVNSNYSFSATVQNISSIQGIILTVNGNNVSGINYNNGQVSANINLVPGLNTFSITVSNGCGTDNAISNVNYENCNAPIVNFTTIPVSGSTTSLTSIPMSAEIINYNSSTSITVMANGNIVNNYNNNNGLITKTVNLPIGTTTFEITASNACGSDSKSYSINRCDRSKIALLTPSNENYTTTNPTENLLFSVENVFNNSEITISQNGIILSGFNLSNNSFQGQVNLINGVNTFVININTACSQITKTITIDYKDPTNPLNNNDGGTIINTNENNGSNDVHDNNGHGNNIDGVDSSNPGQGNGGPNGQQDTNGGVDDENGTQNTENNKPSNVNSGNSKGENQNNSSNQNSNNNKNANTGSGNNNLNKPTVNVNKPNQTSKPENNGNSGSNPNLNKPINKNITPTNINPSENSDTNSEKGNSQKTEPQKPLNKPKGIGGGK